MASVLTIRKGMKQCSVCKEILDIGHFYVHSQKPNYTHSECKKCNKKAATDARKRNPSKHAQALKRYRLKAKYGLSFEQYLGLLSQQNNSCAICSIPFDITKIRLSPGVDHCHRTGRIRGILCGYCNSAIAFLKDDIRVLKNAIAYLDKYM